MADLDLEALSEKAFARCLCIERKRAERSQKPFLLILVNAGELLRDAVGGEDALWEKILQAVRSSVRETDISGWHQERLAFGAIFTEIPPANFPAAVSAICAKVNAALLNQLYLHQVNKLRVTFHVFPETPQDGDAWTRPADLDLYPDLVERDTSKKPSLALKRVIDVAGSMALLALASPLMAAIAAAIKLTSSGPVLFRQQRLGRYGRPFTFLKFRSMVVNNDPSIHRDYIKKFISGTADQHSANGSGVYKLTQDPRVTRVGRLLRKTSLDELPQLLNVVAGRMSLVGPRPPLPYEFTSYAAWHRRRLLEAKPGITGLWQVSGRSQTKFDEMVRLDLRYAKSWSLRLDLEILLKTPRAAFSGAY